MKKTTTPQEKLSWIKREITGVSYEQEHGVNWLIKDIERNWKEEEIKDTKIITKNKYHKLSLPDINTDLEKEHHIRKKFIENHFFEDFNPEFNENEFIKLKSRWSSHKKRRTQKSISISLDRDTYKKLKELKGKHNLNKTISVLIKEAHKGLTTTNILSTKKPTTPILDIIHENDYLFSTQSNTPDGTYTINLERLNDIYIKILDHDKKLYTLISEIKSMRNK